MTNWAAITHRDRSIADGVDALHSAEPDVPKVVGHLGREKVIQGVRARLNP
jgi:hypothetical protein